MTKRLRVRRRLLALLATLLAVTCCVAALPARTAGAVPARSTSGAEVPSTRLTYLVPKCEDCVLFLYGYDSQGSGWGTLGIDVTDGKAEVAIDTALTAGLVTIIQPPWEPDTPSIMVGVPTVAMRYNKQPVGSRVSVDRATSRTGASGCWAGTDRDHHTFRIVVRRVKLPDGTKSTLVFARRTQAWTKPMTAVANGRLRTYVAEPCALP